MPSSDAGDSLPLRDQALDTLVHLGAELERDPARDLRGHREVVRKHDLFELLDDPRRRDREAESERSHRPHLRIGAHHDEAAVVAHELERTARRELAVRLVDDDQAVGRVEQCLDGAGVFDGAGGVVGAAHEHDRGLLLGDERARRVGVDREVGSPLAHHHFGAGDSGDVARATRTWARTSPRAGPGRRS